MSVVFCPLQPRLKRTIPHASSCYAPVMDAKSWWRGELEAVLDTIDHTFPGAARAVYLHGSGAESGVFPTACATRRCLHVSQTRHPLLIDASYRRLL